VERVPHESGDSQAQKEGTACVRAELKHVTPLLTSHIRMIPDFIIEFDRAQNMTDMIAQPL